MDRTTIALLVRNLERRGLVTREKSKLDQRAKIVTITTKGKKLLKTALPAVETAQQRILAPLSEVESAQLLKLLEKLAQNNNALSRAPARPQRRSASQYYSYSAAFQLRLIKSKTSTPDRVANRL